MKVLWFSDTATPAVRERLGIADSGNRAGWVANAAHALAEREGIDIGIVWASFHVREYMEFKSGNITYFCIPRGGWMQSVSRRLEHNRPIRNAWKALTSIPRQSLRRPVRDCLRVIDEFEPDLVHVHGTESFYGLLGRKIDRPMIISLQGILVEISRVYWGSIPWWRRPMFPQELLWHFRMKRNAAREVAIIRQNRYFSGRTNWDRDILLGLNPEAGFYTDGARLLRPQFYGPEWKLENCIRHRLYTTITQRPYKGTDTLIEALALIRRNYPDATLCVGGQLSGRGYGGYLRRRIRQLGLNDNVTLIGFVEAEEIVSELLDAHAFLLGSHIENSPNSVAEAQTIGTPCIATSAGGTPSMVNDEETGLLYTAGDAEALARCIERIFSDDELAQKLGAAGHARAQQRGDAQSNVDTLIEVYWDILEKTAGYPRNR